MASTTSRAKTVRMTNEAWDWAEKEAATRDLSVGRFFELLVDRAGGPPRSGKPGVHTEPAFRPARTGGVLRSTDPVVERASRVLRGGHAPTCKCGICKPVKPVKDKYD